MYRAADSAQHWKANIYFMTLIFFLAWMVKNVFIAVITETFNEIRVQFQEMWVDRVETSQMEGTKTQVLEGDNKAWKLVTVRENRHRGMAPQFCARYVLSIRYNQNIHKTKIQIPNFLLLTFQLFYTKLLKTTAEFSINNKRF